MASRYNFRAWDSIKSEFIDVRSAPQMFKHSVIEWQLDPAHFTLYDDRYELTQGTGLRDENGVELFIGDCYIKYGHHYVAESMFEIGHKVQEALLFDGQFTVIGNIYEGSDLI